MLFALAKKQENIAEYVLYMFQVEDVIRANRFDIESLTYSYIKAIVDDEEKLPAVIDWYADLIKKMHIEGVQAKGHVQEVKDVIIELFYLHNSLLNISKDKAYEAIYQKALPYLQEFSQKADGTVFNDIELCFNALYGKLMLKMQKKTISPETEQAMQAFSQLLAFLAARYKQARTGDAAASLN